MHALRSMSQHLWDRHYSANILHTGG